MPRRWDLYQLPYPACKNPNFCTTVLNLLLARLVVLCFLITPILCADYRALVADYPVQTCLRFPLFTLMYRVVECRPINALLQPFVVHVVFDLWVSCKEVRKCKRLVLGFLFSFSALAPALTSHFAQIEALAK